MADSRQLASMVINTPEWKLFKAYLRDLMVDTALMRSSTLSSGVPQSAEACWWYSGKMNAYAEIHEFIKEAEDKKAI